MISQNNFHKFSINSNFMLKLMDPPSTYFGIYLLLIHASEIYLFNTFFLNYLLSFPQVKWQYSDKKRKLPEITIEISKNIEKTKILTNIFHFSEKIL